MKNTRYLLCGLPGGLLLGGCTVYAPTIPSTPLVEKGQVEVTAGIRGLNALEVGAAWSPVPHLLLTTEGAVQGLGEGSYTSNNVTTTYQDYHRQAGLGVGYYRAPTGSKGFYLAAVGGMGWASVNMHDTESALLTILVLPFLSPRPSFYEARYHRYYGQLYAANKVSERVTAGFSVRGTRVDYTQLLVNGQPFIPANHFFIEPTFFLRTGRGPFQLQATLGFSLPTARDGDNPTVAKTAPTSGLVGLGLVFRPHLLRRH